MASILVVEDNRADIVLLQTALAEIRPDVRIHTVPDSLQALDFVQQKGRYAKAPVCELILLDLNMPGMDGHRFLEILRADTRFRHVPVAVWTSSRNNADVLRAYSAGANAYYRKRSDYSGTLTLIKTIITHWFDAALLPVA